MSRGTSLSIALAMREISDFSDCRSVEAIVDMDLRRRCVELGDEWGDF